MSHFADEEEIRHAYYEARRLMKFRRYAEALPLLEAILLVAAPLAREETPEGVIAPYRDWPEQMPECAAPAADGQMIWWVPDYFTAVLYLAARCFFALKYYEKAALYLSEALDFWPAQLAARSELAFIYCYLERYGDALQVLQEAVVMEPENIAIQAQLDDVAARLAGRHLRVSML